MSVLGQVVSDPLGETCRPHLQILRSPHRIADPLPPAGELVHVHITTPPLLPHRSRPLDDENGPVLGTSFGTFSFGDWRPVPVVPYVPYDPEMVFKIFS